MPVAQSGNSKSSYGANRRVRAVKANAMMTSKASQVDPSASTFASTPSTNAAQDRAQPAKTALGMRLASAVRSHVSKGWCRFRHSNTRPHDYEGRGRLFEESGRYHSHCGRISLSSTAKPQDYPKASEPSAARIRANRLPREIGVESDLLPGPPDPLRMAAFGPKADRRSRGADSRWQ